MWAVKCRVFHTHAVKSKRHDRVNSGLYFQWVEDFAAERLFYAQLLLNILQNANIYFNMENWLGRSWCHVCASVWRTVS